MELAGCALQEQPEGNLMVTISWGWCNGSYTIATKQIKSSEFHNTMIQFLIILHVYNYTTCQCTDYNE